MKAAELKAWITERNRVLTELDDEGARKLMPNLSDPQVRLIAMHKARVEAKQLPRELRLASVEWLRVRNYSRMFGGPLPPPGELPE